MVVTQSYEKLASKKEGIIFIDVRSPREYEEARIPGALNIPVFSNEEHEMIGILYKNEGKRAAVKEALKVVGPKISDLFLEFEKHINKKNKLAVYCARGGMRSSAISALLKEFSIPLIKVEGGYKAYRQYINEKLPLLAKEFQFITLYGKTGSGKTEILQKLEDKGYNILDLEKCANNRGSLLGSIGLGKKNSQKYFESLVFESLEKAKGSIIITEGESRRIGNIVMPAYLYNILINSRKLYIETSLERRIEIIKKEYLKDGVKKEDLIDSVSRLSKYINDKRIKEFIDNIQIENYDKVIQDLMVKYYDKVYNSKGKTYERFFMNKDENVCAEEIANYIFNEKIILKKTK